ncbi:MAG: phospho-N-acetylmuramoyl-pentapeptide-transferase [Chloroflexi bacterium]|nr:phospho-N-acetylmuramoyl-pentapeptide-transferase [Chloroflexota bacterium]
MVKDLVVEAALVGAATFLALLPWGNAVVRALLKRGIGKQIRADEPEVHRAKSGTATMGGIYFLAGITLVTAILAAAKQPEGLAPLIAMLGYGLLGAFDDWRGLQDRGGVGWAARSKFPVQWGTALILAVAAYPLMGHPRMLLPLNGLVIDLGWWNVPILAFLIVAFSNAVNLTDGLDGLAGGTSAIAFLAFGTLAVAEGLGGLASFCAATVGALGAFLWYNAHPAQMFMGDLGSQALGAGLAVVAVQSGHWLLLPVIGAILLIEMLSVMLQVGYFKYTHYKYGTGRRVFRMSPIHYHFELGGWSEVQIVTRAWALAAATAAVGIVLGMGAG